MSVNTCRAWCPWRWRRRPRRCATPASTRRQLSLEQQREIGVVLGSGGGAQEFSEEQVRLWLTGKVKQVSLFCIPSGTMGTLSSEISMRFGLRGMSHVITTGCTSSTDAFGYALRQIQFGFLPMMLVGGVDAPIAPGIMKGFTLMKIMTSSWNDEPERASRPVLGRPRRLRRRRRFVDVRGGRIRTCACTRAKILAEVAGYGRPARLFIACACRSAARNRPAQSRWRWKMPVSCRRRRLCQSARHFDATERSHRDARLEIGIGRKSLPDADVELEIADRTSPGRVRRGRDCRNTGCDASWASSADHQFGEARSRVRSGLRPRMERADTVEKLASTAVGVYNLAPLIWVEDGSFGADCLDGRQSRKAPIAASDGNSALTRSAK